MGIWNQKGEGRGGLIAGLLVLFVAVYLALKIVPVMIRIYTFEDAVKEQSKFLHGRSLEQLEADLVEEAETQELPVDEENIDLKRFHIEEHDEMKVDIVFVIPIVTPVYTYNWRKEIHYQAPVFD
jgi:hypothetical protein